MRKQAPSDTNRVPSESDGACREPAGEISGEFVTETFDYKGGREVTVFVPSNPLEAIVFAGDGQRISRWGPLLEKADVPSTMIVGVHGLTDEMQRLHEYSPGFELERFEAHERLFVEDVRRWTESRFGLALPSERTAVFGVSARTPPLRNTDRYPDASNAAAALSAVVGADIWPMCGRLQSLGG